MKKLVVKGSFIGIILLLGALFGVQMMNEHLGVSQPVPLQNENNEEVKNEIEQPKKNELVEKRQQVEDVGRFNFFSDLGNHIAGGFNYISRAVLSQIMSFVDNVLNG
ncbi:hypothetical protein JCM9140_3053 [Halalkalibacter wakoensis JCM 9140]|uniref:Uncharacterized protein n=1 Tax=Halalkalibacter wakoensis JCM 9140 TaxID=1236970 RepID=W4Q5I5_9BACI|nr:hypothetical protein [Halalkalibacter wakoensis]GAE26943.1 hypothetical protein JCM9140_3053 [Halalkalibacter wakoensis JCM 9140]